jgi:peptidoglycan hydrolase-like protein with peptidoglycan-binding domain/exonuclease VII small subunit
MKKLAIASFFGFALVGVFFASGVASAEAATATQCYITRNLYVGSQGDDVLCLQRYLNNSGFTIASYGAGSPGRETGYFGESTRQAVARWQAYKGISPANGYFTVTTTQDPNYNQPGTTVSQQQKNAQTKMQDAIEMMDDARDAIKKSSRNTTKAKKLLEDAQDDFFDAVLVYFKGNYSSAINYAEDSYDNADEAYDEARGRSNDNDDDEDDVQDHIEDVEDQLDDAWEEWEDSNASSADLRDARELLEDAEDTIDDAWESFDDEDFDDADDYADDAEDLIDEALDYL